MQASQTATREQQTPATNHGLSLPAIARDVATMGCGTLLAAIFNTVLIFLIPRLLSVEAYGYWRLFMLYAGYVGFLHVGFADGALLRWAGRPIDEFQHEIEGSARFLICQQLAVTIPACLIAVWLLPPRLRFIGVAALGFALIMNPATLLQFALQAARLFRPVAVATAAPAGAFLLLILLWGVRGGLDFREVIGFYFIAWAGVLAYLWFRLKPLRGARRYASAWELGKTYVALGWPILLANTGCGLVWAADRWVVSAALPITDFAEYSLAVSTMFVPVTAVAAISRVLFPHFAGLGASDRAKGYRVVSRVLLLAWSLMLPYYFLLEAIVRRYLPKYVPSLAVAMVLLLGVFFLAGIQILHMSFSYLHNRRQEFLVGTTAALIVAFSAAVLAALWIGSLVAIAVSEVVALAFWWLFNEWKLRELTGQCWREWLRVLAVFAWSAASCAVAVWCTGDAGWQTPIYYLLVISVLLFSCPEEFRLGRRLFRSNAVSPL